MNEMNVAREPCERNVKGTLLLNLQVSDASEMSDRVKLNVKGTKPAIYFHNLVRGPKDVFYTVPAIEAKSCPFFSFIGQLVWSFSVGQPWMCQAWYALVQLAAQSPEYFFH